MREFKAYLKELENRTIYRELNPQVIASIPDDKLGQAIRDFTALKIENDWEHDVEKVPALGPGFSAVYFVSIADAEVNNGGFNQLFWNSGREAVVLAKAGADLMKFRALSRIFEEALQIEEAERSKMAGFKEKESIEALMESYDHVSFDSADEKFSALGRKVEKAIIRFIRKHPDLFEGKVD